MLVLCGVVSPPMCAKSELGASSDWVQGPKLADSSGASLLRHRAGTLLHHWANNICSVWTVLACIV